jgi:hypothetical protein
MNDQRRMIAVSLLGLTVACYSSQQSACGSGPSPTPSPSVVVVAPTPTATPTPAASPSASPTPPSVKVCAPPPSSPVPRCSLLEPIFDDVLAQAMSRVPRGTEAVYVAGVIASLNSFANICAAPVAGVADEVQIKMAGDNSRSERWDVVNRDGSPQRLYQSTCLPATF